jgi:hypothetical protein
MAISIAIYIPTNLLKKKNNLEACEAGFFIRKIVFAENR